MKDRFDKQTLTKIIETKYPTETKVAQILALYAQNRTQLLNKISNVLGCVIDCAKEGKLDD